MAQPANTSSLDIMANLTEFTDTLPYPVLMKLAGLVALLVLPLVIGYLAFRGFNHFSGVIQRRAALGAMSKDLTPGNKILIASVRGAGGGIARERIMTAMEEFLPEFNFGSPFYMGAAPISIESTDFALSRDDFERLSNSFEDSGAHLIIWGEARQATKSTRLCFATPAMLKGEKAGGFFTMDLKGSPRDWEQDEFLAIAYVAGKRLRPGLGRPADFRADRLEPILRSMSRLIEADDIVTGRARTELEDDFAAGALHVGETLENAEWLQRSVDFRVKALQTLNPVHEPIRWSQAKIDLGRAMCRLCERKFDPGRLEEAMTHIREGIDNTKSDKRMQLAETGFEALQRAEQMIADRRRFSIRWSV